MRFRFGFRNLVKARTPLKKKLWTKTAESATVPVEMKKREKKSVGED